MKSSLKKKWVEALRSGDYAQGTSYLRAESRDKPTGPDRFCCLGVLCNVVDPDMWTETEDRFVEHVMYNHNSNGKCSLNAAFASRVGLSENAQDFLITLNDMEGRGFEAIATWIEENVK